MGLLPFGAFYFKRAVVGMIKAGMLMQNIEDPSQTLGTFDIRMITHSHHKAFEMRMRRLLIVANSAIKYFLYILNTVIPMRRHGQRVTIQATDDVGVAWVRLYINGVAHHKLLRVAPYEVEWSGMLPSGTYTLEAVKPGFNTVVVKDIRVGLGSTVTLEVTMTVAATNLDLPTLLKLVGDPTRLRILALLHDEELSVGERVRALGVDPDAPAIRTLFDLAGVYPLKMHVAGVLEPTGGPDDAAVFVDIRTSWVIEGKRP